MCGIVGLYLKKKKLHNKLGFYLSGMLDNMSSRGPDSAGFAIYNNKESKKYYKYSLCLNNTLSSDFEQVVKQKFKDITIKNISDHIVVKTTTTPKKFISYIQINFSQISLVGYGRSIEIFKQVGNPSEIVKKFKLENFSGSHAIGHTRMATESAVTTQGAHPFNTGEDLCLVHNGSLSNHNDLKRWLSKERGIFFQTENDTEVAAGYLSNKIEEGLSLKEALEESLNDLDGFFTFTVGTKSGFAVLRDPIACKPAVIAETEDWVAMSSEYRALARLPDVSNANVWEPKPGQVYSWGE